MLKNFESVNDLVGFLQYGRGNAKTARKLFEEYVKSLPSGGESFHQDLFNRTLRLLASEARENGIRVIGDDQGYYIAVSTEEWNEYKRRRFHAMKAELESFARCERLTVQDLIKEVYYIKVENQNYELF